MSHELTLALSLLTGMGGMVCVLLWWILHRLTAIALALESIRTAVWSPTLGERR